MKVATKFALAFLACGVLSVVVYSYVAANREVSRMERTASEDLAAVGRTLTPALMSVWMHEGEEHAIELVEVADRDVDFDARWTWLDVGVDNSRAPRADHDVMQLVQRGTTATWIGPGPTEPRRMYVYVPLLRDDARPAALELSRPLVPPGEAFRAELTEQLAVSTLVVGLATAMAVVLGAWLVSRPLERVVAQARRIGAGDLSQRLEAKGSDEVAGLCRELNTMTDELRDTRARADDEAKQRILALEQLRHADRLRTVGTLASGIAHELGTPLNVILMRAKMIASGETPKDESAEAAKIIAAQADRVTKIVRQLMDFARRRAPNRTKANLGDLAEHVALLLDALAKKARVVVTVERAEEPVEANVDPGQIEQAITNLVINAVHAMPDGGDLVVRVRHEEAQRDDGTDPVRCAVIEVEDEGTGVAPEDLERIFEPFFTTKGVGQGTGLGLSVTHGIVGDHDGWMGAESTLGKGTRFTIYLPVS